MEGSTAEPLGLTIAEIQEIFEKWARCPVQYLDEPCLACGGHTVLVGDQLDLDQYVAWHGSDTCVACFGTGRQVVRAWARRALEYCGARESMVRTWLRESEQWAAICLYPEEHQGEWLNADNLRRMPGAKVSGYVLALLDNLKERGYTDGAVLTKAERETLAEAAMAKVDEYTTGLEVVLYDKRLLEHYHTLWQALRSHAKATQQAAAALAAAPPVAPTDTVHHCRSRPKCKRPVHVRDEQGRWWCKRHAYKRGLLKREPVAASDE